MKNINRHSFSLSVEFPDLKKKIIFQGFVYYEANTSTNAVGVQNNMDENEQFTVYDTGK